MDVKPQRIFIGLAIVIVLFELMSTLIWGEYSVEIPLHDTYWVLSTLFIAIIASLLLLIIAGIYRLSEKYRFNYNKWLTFGHFTSLFVVFVVSKFSSTSFFHTPRRYFSFDTFDAFDPLNLITDNTSKVITISVILSCLFFILNLLIGFIKKDK